MGETVKKLTLAPLPGFIFINQAASQRARPWVRLPAFDGCFASPAWEGGLFDWYMDEHSKQKPSTVLGERCYYKTENPFGHGAQKSISVLVIWLFCCKHIHPWRASGFSRNPCVRQHASHENCQKDSSKDGRGRDVQQGLNAVLCLWHYLWQSQLKCFCVQSANMHLACVRTWISRLWSAKEP